MRRFFVALSILALPFFGIGCEVDDEPDTVGEAIDDAGDEMGDAVEEVRDETEDAFN